MKSGKTLALWCNSSSGDSFGWRTGTSSLTQVFEVKLNDEFECSASWHQWSCKQSRLGRWRRCQLVFASFLFGFCFIFLVFWCSYCKVLICFFCQQGYGVTPAPYPYSSSTAYRSLIKTLSSVTCCSWAAEPQICGQSLTAEWIHLHVPGLWPTWRFAVGAISCYQLSLQLQYVPVAFSFTKIRWQGGS